MKKCPHCANELPESAAVCPHCGQAVSVPASPFWPAALRILPWGLLVLVVGLILALFYIASVKLKAQNQSIAALQTDLAGKQQNLVQAASTIAAASVTRTADQSQLDKNRTALTQLAGDKAHLQATQDVQQKTLSAQATKGFNQSTQIADLNAQLKALKPALCGSKYTFKGNYTSNDTMSAALKEFVEGEAGLSAQKASFYKIWTNLEAAEHVVSVLAPNGHTIGFDFIVFYDESNFTQGTFWVDEQCWLENASLKP